MARKRPRPLHVRQAGASARSQSKPARGVREAGPRSVCVGGPSADFLNEPGTALPRTSYLYSASKANRGCISILHMFWSFLALFYTSILATSTSINFPGENVW
ncbi:hypothetical protein JG688_00012259 [Phytophthora aleatoria]|uniref:Uncharacterized protein n=1 Tax=Phytophthora aleatoria TaxID=2496075 RepID=A0A8J5IYT4_9STRA|nr:hypothetical protein JG688_00012259 [Phytophthora aleatoria]